MIRNVEEKDLPRLRELHKATGFEWEFPENLLSAKVWVDENDEPVMMVGAKVIAEAVLISSKQQTPGMRLAILRELFDAVKNECMGNGITEAITWIPEVIWRPYSRRLKGLGWVESKYKTMCFLAKGKNA